MYIYTHSRMHTRTQRRASRDACMPTYVSLTCVCLSPSYCTYGEKALSDACHHVSLCMTMTYMSGVRTAYYTRSHAHACLCVCMAALPDHETHALCTVPF